MTNTLNNAPHRWIATGIVCGDATSFSDERITNYLIGEGLAQVGDNVCLHGVLNENGFVLTDISVSNALIAQSRVMDIAWKYDYEYPEVLACSSFAECIEHKDAVIQPYNVISDIYYITQQL